MKFSRPPLARLGLSRLLLLGCAFHLATASGQTALQPEKLAEMDAAINEAVAEKRCPGGVLWVEHRGVSHHKAFGNRSLVPTIEPMTEDTIFDAASLTKVVA